MTAGSTTSPRTSTSRARPRSSTGRRTSVRDRGQHHREGGGPDGDRAKVARVLYNRLDKDRKLGAGLHGRSTPRSSRPTRPRRRTGRSRSKYNTYRYEGLPPGPISAPGKAALQAAAQPAEGDWMYFVTVNFDTGETKFAKTQAEHDKIRGGVPGLVQEPSRAAVTADPDDRRGSRRCAVLGSPIDALAVTGAAPGRVRELGSGLGLPAARGVPSRAGRLRRRLDPTGAG